MSKDKNDLILECSCIIEFIKRARKKRLNARLVEIFANGLINSIIQKNER